MITMYELALEAGIRVSGHHGADQRHRAELESAVSIRIIAPVPGKNTVGIEVPNNEKEKVRMKELMQIGSGEDAEVRDPALPRQGRQPAQPLIVGPGTRCRTA